MRSIRICAATALLAMSAGAGLAQDGLADWDWTQFYVGIGGRAGLATATPHGAGADTTLTVGGISRQATQPESGLSLFATLGYTHDFGDFVLGIDGDIDFAGPTEFGVPSSPTFPRVCLDATGDCAAAGIHGTLDTLGHVRLLAGRPVDDNILIFAAGGLAVADAMINGFWAEAKQQDPSISSASNSSYSPGWGARLYGVSLAAGAQVKVQEHVTFRGEVTTDLYVNPVDVGSPTGISAPAGGSMANIAGQYFYFGNTSARGSLLVGF